MAWGLNLHLGRFCCSCPHCKEQREGTTCLPWVASRKPAARILEVEGHPRDLQVFRHTSLASCAVSLEEGKSIASLSPFVIYKTIQSIAGKVKNIKTLRSGQSLVECDSEAHKRNLRKLTTFFKVTCKVELNETLISSKDIIRCAALKGHSNEYILEEMRDQGVTAVRRIHIHRDGILIPTNTFVLTFNTPVLPQHTKIGYLRVAVDIYIPNSLRCYRCQSFGHHEDRCNRPKICLNCRELDHINGTSGQCTRLAKCCTCTGAHSANSRDFTT